MKFNKRNILFKVMFAVLMVFMCFSVCDVEATIVASECEYEFDNKTTDKLFIDKNQKVKSSSGGTLEVGGNTDITSALKSGKCLEKLYKVIQTTTHNTSYFSNAEDARYFNNNLTNSVLMVGTLKSTTKCDDGAEVFVQIDALMKKMAEEKKHGNGGWSSDGDEIAKLLNKYVESETNKYTTNDTNEIKFCDEEVIDAINQAMKSYNDAVSKDPDAPQNSKNTIKKQTEEVEKNTETLKKYILSNKTNVKIPTGDLKKCEDLISEDLMYIINLVLKIIQIGGPILLIIFIAIDFAQVVISNDKDAMNKAVSKAIKRGLAAIALFFIPYLVSLILEWLNTYSTAGINATNCIK